LISPNLNDSPTVKHKQLETQKALRCPLWGLNGQTAF
jgi:hypothetical protein